jgi:hypothetical protein
MTETAGLERGYRRLLACYPRTFRRENEQEILGVLMVGARPGQRRPALAESADLVRGALRLRLRPGGTRPPRTVLGAVKLMYLGAALELTALITIVVTTRSVRAALTQRYPGFTAAQWHGVVDMLVAREAAVAVAIAVWLFLAWANGRGHDWARVGFLSYFALATVAMIAAVAQNAAVYARADLIVGAAIWLVGLAVMVLIFNKESGPYYQPEPAHR